MIFDSIIDSDMSLYFRSEIAAIGWEVDSDLWQELEESLGEDIDRVTEDLNFQIESIFDDEINII